MRNPATVPVVRGSVRRIEQAYEVRGMVTSVTSYDAASGGNVINEVVNEYDDLGRLVKDYQEHEGGKDANSLYVEYEYAAVGTGLRLAWVRYPNGRKTRFDYSGTNDGPVNRLTAIKDDDSSTLAEYSWLGLGSMVVEDFSQPDVKLDYFGGASGTYAGFDRFGRVVDQQWYDYGASAVRDRYTYGHDRASNRLYKENVGPATKDQYYTYDGVYRLTNFDRGDLNVGKTAISGTPAREEDFSLDPTGNWSGYVEKTAGTTDLNQSRTANTVNETSDITETTGTAWIAPAHDTAGNMTTVPKPSSLANGLTAKYDAWNRLVQVTDSATIVAKYEYDGNGRRTKKHLDSQSPGEPDGIDRYIHYFHAGVQLVETRDTTTEADQPENLEPDYQYVWSERYIDAPILRDQNTDADGLCDDARIYYLTDANFNVTTLVDTSGDALERYLYNPYGVVTIYDSTWTNARSTSSYSNQTLYTGRRLDTETGIYYYRARYYSAELGQFISRDPIGYEAGDVNLYRYCGNSPIEGVDPLGLQAVDCGPKPSAKGGLPTGWEPGPLPTPKVQTHGEWGGCKMTDDCYTLATKMYKWWNSARLRWDALNRDPLGLRKPGSLLYNPKSWNNHVGQLQKHRTGGFDCWLFFERKCLDKRAPLRKPKFPSLPKLVPVSTLPWYFNNHPSNDWIVDTGVGVGIAGAVVGTWLSGGALIGAAGGGEAAGGGTVIAGSVGTGAVVDAASKAAAVISAVYFTVE